MINILIAISVFSMFDYIGFNTIGQKNLILYRITQNLFLISLAIGLYFLTGLISSICFLLLFWFWIADLIYYFFYDTLKWYGGDYAGKAFKSEVLGNNVVWSWWTPYGLIFRYFQGKKNMPISGRILILQAIVGIVIVIGVNYL